jgi:hypothetical protein
MQRVARQDDIDAVDGSLADDGDGESDYGQIDEELAAKIMEDLEREWAEEEEEEEAEEEHERMELEE